MLSDKKTMMSMMPFLKSHHKFNIIPQNIFNTENKWGILNPKFEKGVRYWGI
jgi:hypothetical protein